MVRCLTIGAFFQTVTSSTATATGTTTTNRRKSHRRLKRFRTRTDSAQRCSTRKNRLRQVEAKKSPDLKPEVASPTRSRCQAFQSILIPTTSRQIQRSRWFRSRPSPTRTWRTARRTMRPCRPWSRCPRMQKGRLYTLGAKGKLLKCFCYFITQPNIIKNSLEITHCHLERLKLRMHRRFSTLKLFVCGQITRVVVLVKTRNWDG